MRVTFLGTGTSTGVPVPGCKCKVCLSKDPLNRRLRTSAYVEIQRKDFSSSSCPEEVVAGLLIDSSPDLRYQVLRSNVKRVDAVLYSHTHADHIFGIDDLRGFNFSTGREIPLYASKKSAADLLHRFGYCFQADPSYEGGAPPQLTLVEITPFETFEVASFPILPVPLLHGSLEVLGFRFGRFAYLTDCSFIPAESREAIRGVDCLVIDGLRFRSHRTHFTQRQAAEEVEKIAPARAFLTHISHEVDHEEGNSYLKTVSSANIECAYDGLVIEV